MNGESMTLQEALKMIADVVEMADPVLEVEVKEDDPEKLALDALKVGVTFKVYFNSHNPNNMTAHVRAVVDNEHIVYRTWNRFHQGWTYRIDSAYYFGLLIYNGELKVTGREKSAPPSEER